MQFLCREIRLCFGERLCNIYSSLPCGERVFCGVSTNKMFVSVQACLTQKLGRNLLGTQFQDNGAFCKMVV